MASSFKCIYNYPETLLDTLCRWNDTILAGEIDTSATNFTDAVHATGSSDRSRAKEMYRIGLLRLELTKGREGLDHIIAGRNAQSDLGFISSIIAKAKQVENSDSLTLAYSGLCALYSLLQSVTIGQSEISINALLYRLNDIFPCPDDIDFIKWHRYLLSGFLCEIKYQEYLCSKSKDTLPFPTIFEDTLKGENTEPFKMSIRTNEAKGLTNRKTIQSNSDIRDAIATRVSLTDIFQQKMPLFMFGSDSDVIPKGFYGIANKYFADFLHKAYQYEVSDPSRPSVFETLFDEESQTSSKTDALKAIITIINHSSDTSLKTEFNKLMKTIYQGAKEALSILNQDNEEHPHSQTSATQTIYYGCPGTGKSYTVKCDTEGENGEDIIWYEKPTEDDKSCKKFEGTPTDEEKKNLTNNIFRTTFHPDYDYATFVGCYKPVKEGAAIDYKFIPQVFTNAYVCAYRHREDPIYLIIEEINRGNCAQIFGDLFQLLDRTNGESDYAIKPDTELAKYLASQGVPSEELKLPDNLHIYATMNTSDQSLFPMDSAFKRRWAMEYMPINYTQKKASTFTIEVAGKKYPWIKFLEMVNERIVNATDSEDKQMGEFFIKGDVDEREFKNKVMFYLWNDVCKDLYNPRHVQGAFFLRVKNKLETEKNDYFTFAELFSDRNKDSRLLLEFFAYLESKYKEEVKPEFTFGPIE